MSQMQNISSLVTTKPIPRPPKYPIIGHLHLVGTFPFRSFTELAKQYGNIYELKIFNHPIVVISGLEEIKDALHKQGSSFAGRPNLYTLKNAVRGRAIGGRDFGPTWKKHREITMRALDKYVNVDQVLIENQILEACDELIDILSNNINKPFDPEIEINLSVANIMLQILFGEKTPRDDKELIDFVTYAKEFPQNTAGSVIADFVPQTVFIFKRWGFGLDRWLNALGCLEKLILKKLNEHVNSYDPSNLRGMVDALIKASRELSPDEQQDLKLTEKIIVEATPQEMMGTGLLPIAPLIRWAMMYLIEYPELQKRLHRELDSVIDASCMVRSANRNNLPLLEAFIHELLRIAVSFPLALPYCTTTETKIQGYTIPKDRTVFINMYSLTRDERFFKEPNLFNPDRFLNENNQIKEELLDKYFPFGIGKRMCFGGHLARLELFIFIANLIKNFEFSSADNEPLDFEPLRGAVMMPKSMRIKIEPRA
jgi:cytochrome P450